MSAALPPFLGLNRGALLHSTPYPSPAQSGSTIIIPALRLLTAPALSGSTQTRHPYPDADRLITITITILITITITITIIITTVLTTALRLHTTPALSGSSSLRTL